MSLAPGTRLGPYQILTLLGAGGMGEVYRARDTLLGRDVAVKVLPRGFMLDAERLARFEREARVLASLNHPHIAAIYGIERSDGERALILELVEGETVADRLRRAPIPAKEALTTARQIADALDAAHERGIVHRDLKPANVAITHAGVVKVLDFGLAKTTSHVVPDGGPAAAGAATIEGTREGMILGTAAYMSPEQARGQPVDKRTDIWAFGCVLYEMLTKRAPFGGATIADMLAAILEREPDWGALPETTPSSIRRLLQRCLEKDLKRRLHDIADARIEIDDVLSMQTAGTDSGVSRAAARTRERIAWIAAGVSTLSLLVLAVSDSRRTTGPERVLTYSILPPDGTAFVAASPPALSPDGHAIAFVAKGAGDQLLWIRSLDAFDARPLPGTEGAVSPFWSPDGRSLGFFSQRSLKRIDVAGGQPKVLAGATKRVPIGAWNREDKILFEPVANNLSLVSASGGESARATELDQTLQEENHLGPAFLPDGRHYLFLVRGGPELELQVWVGELGSTSAGCC